MEEKKESNITLQINLNTYGSRSFSRIKFICDGEEIEVSNKRLFNILYEIFEMKCIEEL